MKGRRSTRGVGRLLRSVFRVFPGVLGAVAAWSTTTSAFEPVTRFPFEALEDTPIGLRGVLDNRGKHVHNVGSVLCNVTNFGVIGSMPWSGQSFDTAASLQWPAGSGVEHLFAAGLWVGARRYGEVGVTAWEIDNERLLLEVFPGTEPHQRIYEAHEFEPGGLRAPAPRADDDGDGRIDEDRLDGLDNDQDGLVDEDYAAISDQMFTCEYRDDDPRIRLWAPDHRPLGIHVRQTTLAWSSQETDDFIGLDYEVTNVGPTPLYDMYLGFFADFDIGPLDLSASSQDDMAGYWDGTREVLVDGRWRSVRVSIAYMFDADGDEGRSPGHVGIVFLGRRGLRAIPSAPELRFPAEGPARVHNYQAYTRFSSATHGGKPINDEDRYELLAGTGTHALDPDDVPLVTTTPNDYSTLLSMSPIGILEPGESVSLKLALVLGGSFDEMIDNAVQAILLHEGMWFDVDGDPTTGVGGRELQLCGPEYTGTRLNLDCCPEPIPKDCLGKVPEEGCVWTNGDCNGATGIGGRETHVPWTGAQPPPAPNMRIVGHENIVEIFWDNRSEVMPDPLSRLVDFESYRVWRADNWTRPLGTTRSTGPGPAAWLLMAEYDLPGNGIGWDSGLEEIGYEPVLPEGAVSFYRDWFREFPGMPPPQIPGLTEAECDTAQAMALGTRYYRFVDPPFVRNGMVGDPCPANGVCAPLQTSEGLVPTRCNDAGRCAQVTAPPKSGMHLFYSVTATDHRYAERNGRLVASERGLIGGPSTNFQYLSPPTTPLAPEDVASSRERIYVVPNPATNESMQPWALDPTNDDPTGLKVEFHHLPLGVGHVSIYTLAGDLVVDLPFDSRAGNGTLAWNLLSRNRQEITSGVYLYVVEADTPGFERFISRFVVIR